MMLKMMESAKKGLRNLSAFLRVNLRSCNSRKKRRKGRPIAVTLERRERRKKRRLSPHQRDPCCSRGSLERRYARSARRENELKRSSFRAEAHAIASACSGCTAKRSAPKKGSQEVRSGGCMIVLRSRKTRTALRMCSRRL